MPPFDLDQARADTPGCAHRLHFNNAGAALPPQVVLEAQIAHLELEARIGGYEAAAETVGAVDATYAAVAELIGAQRDEIALVDSATTAWHLAFGAVGLKRGDVVVTARATYATNFISLLHAADRRGVELRVAPDDAHGQVDVAALEAMVDRRTRLIALTHIPTSNGLINPAAAVGRVARRAGVLYLLDACQSAGQVPLDVEAIGCDLLSATGRKYLRGPRGTGFLYARRDALERLDPPRPDLTSARWLGDRRFAFIDGARRFEQFEHSRAARIGLGVAVRYALDHDFATIARRLAALAKMLRAALAEVPGVEVRDRGLLQGGIVTFTVAGQAPYAVKAALNAQSMNVSVVELESARFDLEPRGLLDGVVRASVHAYNTADEIDRFVGAVERIARGG